MSKNKLAQSISFLTLPLWIPLFISLNFKNTSDILWASASCIALLGMVFLYKTIGLLTSLHMPTRAERLLPLATSILVYLLCTVLCLFYAKNMYSVYLLAFFTVLGLYIANLWNKISIHVAGTTAGTCYFAHFYSWHVVIIGISIFLILIVVWARLYLKAHTIKQIIIGFFIGIISYALSLFSVFAQ